MSVLEWISVGTAGAGSMLAFILALVFRRRNGRSFGAFFFFIAAAYFMSAIYVILPPPFLVWFMLGNRFLVLAGLVAVLVELLRHESKERARIRVIGEHR